MTKAFTYSLWSLVLLVGCQSNIHLQAPQSAPETNAVKFGLQSTIDSQLRIAPKNLIASTLGSVFGSGLSHPLQQGIITTQIGNQFTGMGGGPCDPNIPGNCLQRDNSLLPLIPSSGSIRQSFITRACHQTVSLDDAVSFAATQILNVSNISVYPLPTEADLSKAFDMFYTGQPLSSEILIQLQSVVSTSQENGYPNIEAWRFVFLTLCLSPGWQIL